MKLASVLAAFCLMPAICLAQPEQVGKTPGVEQALKTPDGMTLYVSDDDEPGLPAKCVGQCAKLWPPYRPKASEKPNGEWSIVDTDDGQKQWAYKGRPVYTFERDHAPGETNGKSFNGNRWHIAAP